MTELGYLGFRVLGFWGFGVLGFWGFGVLGLGLNRASKKTHKQPY